MRRNTAIPTPRPTTCNVKKNLFLVRLRQAVRSRLVIISRVYVIIGLQKPGKVTLTGNRDVYIPPDRVSGAGKRSSFCHFLVEQHLVSKHPYFAAGTRSGTSSTTSGFAAVGQHDALFFRRLQ